MELLAIAAIIAIAALAGGKKNGNGNGKADESEEGKKREPKPLPDEDKAAGNPPNMSGDAEGYNTQRWPDTATVCKGFGALGYDVRWKDPQGEIQLSCDEHGKVVTFDKSVVMEFQRDYNKVSKIPGWEGAKGTLTLDGIAGANSLNAMEHAELLGIQWKLIVGGFPPPGQDGD